jgi:hypothetical protein
MSGAPFPFSLSSLTIPTRASTLLGELFQSNLRFPSYDGRDDQPSWHSLHEDAGWNDLITTLGIYIHPARFWFVFGRGLPPLPCSASSLPQTLHCQSYRQSTCTVCIYPGIVEIMTEYLNT